MDLATIEMPKEQAEEAFKEYRHAVRSAKVASTNSEDAQIMRAYKALAEGKQVLNLEDAFATAGYDDRGLPRLAVSRADHKQVFIQREWIAGWPKQTYQLAMIPPTYTRGRHLGERFVIPEGPIESPNRRYQSVVPNIPPHLRPPSDLKNYHLLWEPEWRLEPRPPRDPALLKHLGGPLYAVLAVWDLTDVEMAVLGITRR